MPKLEMTNFENIVYLVKSTFDENIVRSAFEFHGSVNELVIWLEINDEEIFRKIYDKAQNILLPHICKIDFEINIEICHKKGDKFRSLNFYIAEDEEYDDNDDLYSEQLYLEEVFLSHQK